MFPFLEKECQVFLTVSFIISDKNVDMTAQIVLGKADLLLMTKTQLLVSIFDSSPNDVCSEEI